MDEEGDLLVDVGKRLRIRAGLEGGPRAADLRPRRRGSVPRGRGRRVPVVSRSRPPRPQGGARTRPGLRTSGAAGQAAFEDRPHDELVREPRRRAGRLPFPLQGLRPRRERAPRSNEGQSRSIRPRARRTERSSLPSRSIARRRSPARWTVAARRGPSKRRSATLVAPVLEGGVAPEPDPRIDRVDVVREIPEAPGGNSGALERPLRGPGEAPGRLDAGTVPLSSSRSRPLPSTSPLASDDLEAHVEVRRAGDRGGTRRRFHLDPRDLAERGREGIDDPGRGEARPREVAPGGVAEWNDPPADRAGQGLAGARPPSPRGARARAIRKRADSQGRRGRPVRSGR